MKVERKKEIHKLLQRILKMGYQMVDSETLVSLTKRSYPWADRMISVLNKEFGFPIVFISKKKYLLIDKNLVKKFPPSAVRM